MDADNSRPEEDTFKILISSDNHLGVNDTNPYRENDSFITFEEIFSIGKNEGVDFVLLGGDLFHENKPKPATFRRTLDILQTHCLGQRPVSFEYLGDPKHDFHGQTDPCVNYYNPNMNIELPIFTIHGNHDDPIGLKKTSVIDHLAAANLVNHFGAVNNLNNIRIRPVLLRKGETYLALYGLGALKDERLHNLMREGKVKFLRPEENRDKWFNIFVIHQNRVKHGPTNYIPEAFIPGFIDLVVWGHEHECIPTLEDLRNNSEETDQKCTQVLQPGSSVATQLQPGEAAPKHAIVLMLYKRQFRIFKHPLKTIRPFILNQVLVSDILKTHHRNAEKAVETYLETRIENLIREASDLLTGHEQQPIEPLIRIRLLHEDDVGNFNPLRFNQRFQDKIANEDIVTLSRLTTKPGELAAMDLGGIQEMIMAVAEDIDLGSHVEEIVEKHFRDERAKGDSGNFLHVLSEKGLSEAIRCVAEKDDQGAIDQIIDSQIEKTIKELEKLKPNTDTIEGLLIQVREARLTNQEREAEEVRNALRARPPVVNKKSTQKRSTDDSDYENGPIDNGEETMEIDSDEDGNARAGSSSSSGQRGRGGRGRGRGANTSTAQAPTKTRGRGSRGGGRGRGASPKGSSNGQGSQQQGSLNFRVKGRTTVPVFDISESD